MRAKLKPLAEQVVVITGASSGIGLATARKAAKAGAAVVLVARNEDALRKVCEEINAEGGRAHPVPCDVGDVDEVAKVARAAIARFGGFDTWINDAGVGLYGELTQVTPEDHERLFRTNYFGVVNGSLEAARHFRDRPGGGAIINLGSVLSDIATPLMGAYSASKHAVKGFTDALRVELLRARAPVSVTLIKPSSVSTPFADHAKNYMDNAARVPPPVYAPEVVADAILYSAVKPTRQLTVGSGGRQMVLGRTAAPALADRIFGAILPPLSRRRGEKPARDSLHQAGEDGRTGTDAYRGRRFSIYTEAQKNSGVVLAVGGLALAVAAAWFGRKQIATAARPALARAARPVVLKAARRRPLQAARLAAAHPREAFKLARALR